MTVAVSYCKSGYHQLYFFVLQYPYAYVLSQTPAAVEKLKSLLKSEVENVSVATKSTFL